MRFNVKSFLASVPAIGIGILCLSAGSLFAQTLYYEGKTITIIRGGSPGGSGDMQARGVLPFFKKYIPGQPTIIIENMPGAAGRKAANFISTAKPDGLKIGAVGAGLVIGPILGLPGTQYSLDKLIYLGSTESGDPYVFFTHKQAKLDTLDKVRAASGIRIGAQTVSHPNYVSGRIIAYLLGLKDPKFVVGYSGPEIDIALARGELDARANTSDTIVRRNLDEFEKGDIKILATITIPRGKYHPRFNNVPDMDTFAKNERERQLLNLFRIFLYPRWPYILPPGTPPEIVKILREAMAKAFKDPAFPKEYTKVMGGDPSPLTGEEVETAIRELPRDPETITLYKKMAEHGPLPPR